MHGDDCQNEHDDFNRSVLTAGPPTTSSSITRHTRGSGKQKGRSSASPTPVVLSAATATSNEEQPGGKALDEISTTPPARLRDHHILRRVVLQRGV